MSRKKIRNPVDPEESRFGLFMNNDSFDLEVMYGREYLKTDINHKITLHRINITKSKTHNLYGQSKPSDKKFLPPVELNVMPTIEESTQKYYGDTSGGITRDDSGNLIFGVFLKELEEKNVEINRGDIISYNMSGYKNRYYEVESANNVTDTTNLTIAGFKSVHKKIISVPVKEDVIPFLNETDR